MIPADQNIVMPLQAQIALDRHFGETFDWQSIVTEGTRYALFQAKLDSQHWIARVEPDTLAAPGVDPWREQTVLRALTAYEWAISAEFMIPDMGLLVMPFAGSLIARDELSASQVDEICHAVQQMHSITNVPLLDYTALFEHYREAFSESLPGMGQLVDETEILLATLPDIGKCLVHHDLHPGNMLWGPHLTLIDWEYAGLGNPWLDYATLERDVGLTLSQLQNFERLSGFEPEEMEHWLACAIQVIDQLEMLWQHFNQLQIKQLEN